MDNLLQFKINVRISHLEHQYTYNSFTKIACCSSELIFMFLYEHSSIQTVGEKFITCTHLSFLYPLLFIQPHKHCHFLKYLLVFLNHPIYIYIYIICVCVCVCMYVLFENVIDFKPFGIQNVPYGSD